MATTLIALQPTTRTGLEVTTQAAASGDGNVFDNSGRDVLLYVENNDASPMTVQVDTPGTFDGLAIGTKDTVVTNGEFRLIGPFPSTYNQVDNDNSLAEAVKVTYSAVTSVLVAAIQIGSLAT